MVCGGSTLSVSSASSNEQLSIVSYNKNSLILIFHMISIQTRVILPTSHQEEVFLILVVSMDFSKDYDSKGKSGGKVWILFDWTCKIIYQVDSISH